MHLFVCSAKEESEAKDVAGRLSRGRKLVCPTLSRCSLTYLALEFGSWADEMENLPSARKWLTGLLFLMLTFSE